MALGAARAQGTGVSGRRHTEVAGEQPLEVVRRIADRRRQLVEPGRLVRLPAHPLGAGGEDFHDGYICQRADDALGLAAQHLGESLVELTA